VATSPTYAIEGSRATSRDPSRCPSSLEGA